jgi:hypothetical protein
MIHTYTDRSEPNPFRNQSPALCAGLLSLIAGLTHAQECAGPVYPLPLFQVGDFPTQVEHADVNGDGHADLLTLNTQSRTISVLLGRGDGTFEAQFGFFAGQDGIDMQLADFDADGDPDLVVLNRQNVQVSYFTNPGDGRFASRVTYPLQEDFQFTDLYSMTVDDLDGDGDLDVLVPRPEQYSASALWNNGSGSFTLEADYEPVEWDEASFIARADLDGDGDLDFVYTYDFIGVCTALNNGDGTYADGACVFSKGPSVSTLQIGDLNADGFVDLVGLPSQGFFESEISVYLNDGTGGFIYSDEYGFFDETMSVSVGDLDQDGDTDLVVGYSNRFGDGGASILFNDGNGAFDDEELVLGDELGVGGVRITDITGDGLLDLLYTISLADRAGVLVGRGADGFVLPEQIAADANDDDFELFDADLDGDADLISADPSTGELLVSMSLRNGQFADASRYPAGESAYLRGVADFNGDSYTDVLLATPSSSPVVEGAHAVLLNNGNGTFGGPLSSELLSRTTPLSIVDFNADGTPDLVELNQDVLYLYEGAGDGTFGAGVQLHELVSLDRFEVFEAGDLDQDGHVDFIAFGQVDDALWYLVRVKNNADGTFSQSTPMVAGLRPSGVELRDLDTDGDLDLITVNAGSDDANVYINSGQGQLASGVRYTTGDEHFYHELVDYDQDGDLDLITVSDGESNFTVLKNDGNAGFAEKEHYSGIGFIGNGGFRVGDIDASGSPDIVASNNNGFVVYLDECSDRAPCPADLNGDGQLTFFDVSAFLQAYGDAHPDADFNGDGMFNFFDVTAFIVSFNGGCP